MQMLSSQQVCFRIWHTDADCELRQIYNVHECCASKCRHALPCHLHMHLFLLAGHCRRMNSRYGDSEHVILSLTLLQAVIDHKLHHQPCRIAVYGRVVYTAGLVTLYVSCLARCLSVCTVVEFAKGIQTCFFLFCLRAMMPCFCRLFWMSFGH